METKRIEKEHLVRVCCQRIQGAKAEAAAVAARRMSEFDALLETSFRRDEDDSPRGKLYRFANSAAEKANEEIAHLAEESGTDLCLGPQLTISYGQWPEIVQHCSEEDWRVAGRRIRRLEREAAAQIERTSMDTLVQLMEEKLTPAEAMGLVQAIPAAAELISELKREDLKWEPDDAGEVQDALDSAETHW
uniref:Uncharacterized protein n=1 Tax=Solibacter usitatus (strain Ellin6076) TaxID=234267 RepID=Q027Z7_SOLUE